MIFDEHVQYLHFYCILCTVIQQLLVGLDLNDLLTIELSRSIVG